MRITYKSNHSLRLICEFINNNRYVTILKELVDDSENISIYFSDENTVSSNSLHYNISDMHQILLTNRESPHLTEQYKIEIIQFLCNRYVNLIKEYILTRPKNKEKFLNQTYKTHALMLIGRFREHIMESIEKDGNELYEILIKGDHSIIENKIKLFKMEQVLGDSTEEKALLNLICKPYLEKNDDFNDKDSFDESMHNNFSTIYNDNGSLKSLVIPKIKPVNNVANYKLEGMKNKKHPENYINSSNLNKYMEELLEIQLKHHIDLLGKDGKIPKKKVYSDYGVTPYLLGSSSKSSEQVRQYDEDITLIEDELNISQLIVISFLMNLRYMSRENNSKNKISKAARIHQIIASPNSDITVPQTFIKNLQELIESYAEDTKLSNNKADNKDSSLIKLIEAFLLSRFGLSSLNAYNNLSVFTDDLHYYVKELLTYGSDHISLLGIDLLTYKLNSAYNEWLDSIHPDDSSIDYDNLYDRNIDLLYSLFNIPDDNINSLHDTSSNDSYIKERFRALL